MELQGNLVVDDDGAMANVDIGTLRYVNGVPTIRIGNHILAGKVAKLPKPFAILQKDDGAVSAAVKDVRLQGARALDAGEWLVVVQGFAQQQAVRQCVVRMLLTLLSTLVCCQHDQR